MPTPPSGLFFAPGDQLACRPCRLGEILGRGAAVHTDQALEPGLLAQSLFEDFVIHHSSGVEVENGRWSIVVQVHADAIGAWQRNDLSRVDQTILPCGFAGRVESWHELSAESDRVLRLPMDAIGEGSHLRIPEGQFSTILIEGLSERFGNVERFLAEIADHLEDGGTLLIDALNLQSPELLRTVMEGQPGQNDPAGSFSDPEHRIMAERLISAASAAGLLITDIISVPSVTAIGPTFSQAMIAEGFMALGFLGRTPPSRYWLRCCKRALVDGTVLIGTGTVSDQNQTERSLQQFLPEDWQISRCGGADEVVGFNRAICESSGELIWMLRAGTTVTEDLFRGLLGTMSIAPAMPESQVGVDIPGDVSGLMIEREQLMRVGPISEEWNSPCLAYEDWRLRMNASKLQPTKVVGGFESPMADPGSAENFDLLSGELIDRWQGISEIKGSGGAAPKSARSDQAQKIPWEGRKPKISLCMITRNEEQFIGKCLQHVAPVVDEIIIVDTGSTDRTVEIAESFGARVMHRPWDDDFSTPRNIGIDAATGDWILIIDADEILDEASHCELLQAVKDPEVSGYHLTIENQFSGGKTLGVLIIRLFRNLPGARFRNLIHEQVAPALLALGQERGLKLSVSKIKLLHHGYMDEVVQTQKKNERNERLFRKHLEQNPEDTYILYKYGDFLRRMPRRTEECIEILQKALDLILTRIPGCPRGLPYASEVAALCALECAKNECFDRAEEILNQALRRFMPTPNLHYVAAGVALRCGDPDRAIAHYRCCLNYHGAVLVVPIQEGVTSYVSLTGMAMAHLQKGCLRAAKRLLNRSIQIRPNHEVSILALSRIAMAERNPRQALQCLTEFMNKNPDAAGVCQQASAILASIGEVDHARRIGERAVVLLERDALDHEAKRMKESLAALV